MRTTSWKHSQLFKDVLAVYSSHGDLTDRSAADALQTQIWQAEVEITVAPATIAVAAATPEICEDQLE